MGTDQERAPEVMMKSSVKLFSWCMAAGERPNSLLGIIRKEVEK